MNPYAEPATPENTRRKRRIIVEYRLPTAIPADQLPLEFEPPQPAQAGELTIEARFQEFHRANPHVYQALLNLALAEIEQGARVVRTKHLFEELRSRGCTTVTAPGETFQLNNIYTRCYARLLDQHPRLMGRIPMRAIKSE
jgi:hypothetical protein